MAEPETKFRNSLKTSHVVSKKGIRDICKCYFARVLLEICLYALLICMPDLRTLLILNHLSPVHLVMEEL